MSKPEAIDATYDADCGGFEWDQNTRKEEEGGRTWKESDAALL